MEYIKEYEPNKLKNEITVRKQEMVDLFDNHPVYVFGYGSLLYPEGWYGRGLDREPMNDDLIECNLSGFERGPWGLYAYKNFYGVIRTAGKEVNGVLLHIKSLLEWVNLMSTEMIAGLYRYANYRVVDITDSVDIASDLPTGSRIHAVCNRPINREKFFSTVPQYGYYNRVWKGVKEHRSAAFADKFLKTGGVTGDIAIETILRKNLMEELKKNDKPRRRTKMSGVRKRAATKKRRAGRV